VVADSDDCMLAGWKDSQVLWRTSQWRNWQTMSAMNPLLSLCAPSHCLMIAPSTSVSSVSSAYYTHSREHRLSTRIKGKERKSIYVAPFCTKVHTKRSGMDHTVLPANNTIPAFPSWHSPDGTTTATEAADIQLQLTTHLSTLKG